MAGEVSAAVRQALEAKYQGKNDKAHKLFQHALALDPNHADALNEYGEFIEKEDIVRANYLLAHMLLSLMAPTPRHWQTGGVKHSWVIRFC